MNAIPLVQVEDCWNRIGVWGDQSCPTLVKMIHCRNCPVYTDAGRALFDRPPPEGYTAEWTERIAQTESASSCDSVPVLLFRVGNEWFALDVAYTVEVAPHRQPRRIPHQTDKVLAGLVNIRGELQLAVSLQHLLGTSETNMPQKTEERRLLVVEKSGSRWVLLVDALQDLYYFPRADLGPLPATVSAGASVYTRGVFQWNGRAVGYLNGDRLFNALRRTFR